MEPGGNSPFSLAGEPWSDAAPCVPEWPPCLGPQRQSFGWVPRTGGGGLTHMGPGWAPRGSRMQPLAAPGHFVLASSLTSLDSRVSLTGCEQVQGCTVSPEGSGPRSAHPAGSIPHQLQPDLGMWRRLCTAASNSLLQEQKPILQSDLPQELNTRFFSRRSRAVSCESSQHGAEEPQLFLNGGTCLKPVGIQSFPIPGADPHLTKATLPQGGDVLWTTSWSSPSLMQEVS